MQAAPFISIISVSFMTIWQSISATLADTELSKTSDCTQIELEAFIDPNTSRESNLERLSQQFFQSVNTIEHCNNDPQEDKNKLSSRNALGATTAYSNEGAESDVNAQVEPTGSASTTANQTGNQTTNPSQAKASTSLIGTELDEATIKTVPSSASNMVGTTPLPETAFANAPPIIENRAETAGQQSRPGNKEQMLTNGKIPDDIPNAANDSVFEAQIRAAAIAETDPDTQNNLWNEYRRYKGLPERE